MIYHSGWVSSPAFLGPIKGGSHLGIRYSPALSWPILMIVLLPSETAPNEGTLKVFPDVVLSNAYTILRPFFRAKVADDDSKLLDPENWEFGNATPFPLLNHF